MTNQVVMKEKGGGGKFALRQLENSDFKTRLQPTRKSGYFTSA